VQELNAARCDAVPDRSARRDFSSPELALALPEPAAGLVRVTPWDRRQLVTDWNIASSALAGGRSDRHALRGPCPACSLRQAR
jgi:hypothetical protein